MHFITRLLLLTLIFIPYNLYASDKLLIEIEYNELEIKFPLEHNDSVTEITNNMQKNSNFNILIEASAYKDYAPLPQLRIIALKRAMEIRKSFLSKGADIERISINILDMESNKENKIKIYQVGK
ncbi:hypothetical protein I862_05430 [endosymbiont of Acanthamoeba sp. UWC8]|uniref:hypothetical protein n=1 Tax=endosymbiont of Acanthamoeba sp. UWC8 TaxID=86106 RepID=UPI0004D1280E|nr:hypothetical protein [endosymbiont of Acanthamoeba sp. UWC8]AIF81640.1 hypothetical protein I862_05430 [endosymbiont of Acanthamoeba sp. UWC8]